MRGDHGEGRTADPARGRLGAGVHADLSTRAGRSLVYGTLGLANELVWTGVRGRPRTSVWMLPVYALAGPLFEPAHDRLRRQPPVRRAVAYGLGFTAVEYVSGRALRRTLGSAPWDYGHARANLHGLVRADYVLLWSAYGLALERVHDVLERKQSSKTSWQFPRYGRI